MSRQTLTSSFTLTSAGGDADLLEVIAASDHPFRLVSVKLSQSSEIAEAQEESIRLQFIRMTATVTSGSGGGTPGVEGIASDDAGENFTSEINNTTLATTSGATSVLEEFAWNVRTSPLWFPYDDPDNRYAFKPGEAFLIRLPSAVNDDMTFQLTVIVEEF